ncbi:MAG TPA: hypothetical protein VH188_11370 [Chthoniobacterales bacterium]|jgi:hypothetical protein|nr:hypothetical protein [Chthoniobacterales bacterium]
MPESRRTRSDVLGALSAGGLVVLFCLVLLRHDPLLFWNDDYELSILPVFADVARSWSHGEWPLLSPYSWVCGNLAGEYQYGTFSVFVNAAVVLIWKFPLTFPQQAAALSIAHLSVLAMGGYLLARGRNLVPSLSMMVAFVAALNGWIVCWGATDWFGALGAFAWLPWAWWGMDRALDPQRSKWRFLWPAPFVYLVLTGGFPYTVLMLALIAGWLAVRSLGQTRNLRSIVPLFFGALLGIGLAAPAWLALLDYVHGSARSVQDAAEHFQWRVPAAALPGFIIPNWTVLWSDFSSRLMPHTANELTCGVVPPVALIAGLIGLRRVLIRRIGWELGLLLIALILCMLPTAGVFRWSFRWLPLVHLVLALCAAEALQLFGQSRAIFTRSWLPAVATFAALLATYLWIPPNCGVPKYNLAQELTQPAPLDPHRLYLSIYPAPEDAYRIEKHPEPFGTTIRPGSTSMWGGVSFVNGYSPIRPSGVAREFDSAIHGEISPTKATALLDEEGGPDGLLARIGVDGIIVANEIDHVPEPASEWPIVAATNEGRVFHRREPLPRIRSLTSIDSRPNERFVEAVVSEISDARNAVAANVTTSDGPALLAISRPFFNGYCATLAGHALPVTSYRSLIPLVEIAPRTSGRLEVVYRPWWLIVGVIVAALSFVVMLGSATMAISRRSRR